MHAPIILTEDERPVELARVSGSQGRRIELEQRSSTSMSMTIRIRSSSPAGSCRRSWRGASRASAKALAALPRAMELDPNGYKAAMDGALSNPATAAYRKMQDDQAFMAQVPH